MKKKITITGLILLVVFVMLIPSVSTSAKSISKSQLKRKYKSWAVVNGYDLDSAKIKFVDIDGNGVIEAIFQEYAVGGTILTYNRSKGKIVVLCAVDGIKVSSPISYNKRKHMFATATASRYDCWVDFYKLKGKKIKKVKSFYDDDDECRINGKRVSYSKYKKQLKSMKKGFKFGWLPNYR